MGGDTRVFFKVDVGYFRNPKILALLEDSREAVLLHLAAIGYARQHLTDGVVPTRVVMRDVQLDPCGPQCGSQCEPHCGRMKLREAGLFEAIDARTDRVHDYERHNQTAADVQKVKDAARAGAEGRWAKAKGAISSADRSADGNADRTDSRMRSAMQRREEKIDTSGNRPDVDALLDHLDAAVASNGFRKPNRTVHNVTAMRLLLDRDERTPDEVREVIDYATSDEFWRPNIRSATKLRAKFDTLSAQASRGRGRGNNSRPASNRKLDGNGNEMPEAWW